MSKNEIDLMLKYLRDIIGQYGNIVSPNLLRKIYQDLYLSMQDLYKIQKAFGYACVYMGLILLNLDNEKIYNISEYIGVHIDKEEEDSEQCKKN